MGGRQEGRRIVRRGRPFISSFDNESRISLFDTSFREYCVRLSICRTDSGIRQVLDIVTISFLSSISRLHQGSLRLDTHLLSCAVKDGQIGRPPFTTFLPVSVRCECARNLTLYMTDRCILFTQRFVRTPTDSWIRTAYFDGLSVVSATSSSDHR
jgi:hypothetical protein